MKATIAIVGTGYIGRGWAARFASAGMEVRLWDSDPAAQSNTLNWLDNTLPLMEQLGLIEDATSARSNVRGFGVLEDALEGVDYVQENVPEDLLVKRALHVRIDEADCASAVVGSSTSTFPGSRIFSGLKGVKRCLVAHPANPPHLLPVVELVPTPATSANALEWCRALMRDAGQVPVLLKKEIEGFVMNRLQAGVICEAVYLVASGVIDPDDLDAVMRHSLGLRWSFMGPFETMDLNAPGGFLEYARRYGDPLRGLGRDLRVAADWPHAVLEHIEDERRLKVASSALVDRCTWRDRRLMALAAHKKHMDAQDGNGLE